MAGKTTMMSSLHFLSSRSKADCLYSIWPMLSSSSGRLWNAFNASPCRTFSWQVVCLLLLSWVWGNKINLQASNLDCTYVLNFGSGSWQILEQIFYLKILDKSWQETNVYLLNEYIAATMDYYIAWCIFASIPQCRDLYIVFEEQVALYKALNGTNRWRNWRQKLLTCFQSWEAKFPATSRSNRRISTELAAAPRPEELHVPVGCI